MYHSVVSTVLFQAPRFIPHSFGTFAEENKVTPEILWGTAHGIIGLGEHRKYSSACSRLTIELGMIFWWQATVGMTAQLASMQRRA